MYYLFISPGRFKWTSFPIEIALEKVKNDPDIEITDWNWKTVEEPAPHEEYMRIGEAHLRIALRTGFLNKSGIIVDAGDFSDLRYILQMIGIRKRELSSRSEAVRQAREIDTYFPGYLARLEDDLQELDSGVREISQRKMRNIDSILSKPLNDRLVNYWTSNGGLVPEEDRNRS